MTNPPARSTAAILVAKFQLREAAEDRFSAWQARALTRAAGADGFFSSEIAPPSAEAKTWAVTFRFRDSGSLDAWRTSPDWQTLLSEAQPLLADGASVETEVRQAG